MKSVPEVVIVLSVECCTTTLKVRIILLVVLHVFYVRRFLCTRRHSSGVDLWHVPRTLSTSHLLFSRCFSRVHTATICDLIRVRGDNVCFLCPLRVLRAPHESDAIDTGGDDTAVAISWVWGMVQGAVARRAMHLVPDTFGYVLALLRGWCGMMVGASPQCFTYTFPT